MILEAANAEGVALSNHVFTSITYVIIVAFTEPVHAIRRRLFDIYQMLSQFEVS
jgi:hypothetical protein